MTGYTVHTGASKKFVAGWDNIFGDKKEDTAAPASRKKSAKAAKKSKAKKKK